MPLSNPNNACTTCPVLKAVEDQKEEIERLKAQLAADDRMPLKPLVVQNDKAKTVPLWFTLRKFVCYGAWIGATADCMIAVSNAIQFMT